MPSTSKAQQHYLGMKYAQAKAGKPTGMDMTTSQLRDFAATKTKGLPGHVKKRRTADLGSVATVKRPTAAGRY
jgi:hypothetical protein